MHKYGCYIYKVFQIWKFYYTFWLVALLKWCKVFVPDWRTDKQFFNKFCLNDNNILIFFIFSRSMNNCILLGSPMAEIVDPWILDPEGLCFKFSKTVGFREGNSKILQLIKRNTKVHTPFFCIFKLILKNKSE